MPTKSVVLLRCHDQKPNTLENIRLITEQSPFDVYIVYDSTNKQPYESSVHKYFNFSIFDYDRTGYPLPTEQQVREIPTPPPNPVILPIYYNPEIANILFWKEHPEYEHYWYIEYDVFFNGIWKDFFSYYDNSDEDLLCPHLAHYPFSWWKKSQLETHLPVRMSEDCIFRFFGCIARYSNKLLDVLDTEYLQGNIGFYELIVPSLCALNGLKLSDLNKEDLMVYTPLTLGGANLQRMWNQKFVDECKNMLFHPIR
ncbi:MAG: DUF3405 domain-containing protein [Bacteroidetes bacterium]|nr:DUF3405 domain-containing protein [Bacteroidota bacterium]